MKAIALAYGGLLLVFFLGSLVIMDVIAKGDVKRDVVSREGKLISFVNEAEMLIRSFDQSIYFISQRAAYELAKNGGAYKGPKIFWTEDDPKIDFLERNLEDKIKDNLPSSDYTREERKITWGESVIDVCDYLLNPPCGPIELSECFLVDGSKYLVVYDKSIDSRISVNQDINSNVDSNYFRLLNAGRTIMEDPLFNQHLNDVGTLLNLLFIARGNGDPRFVNLDFIIDVKNETDEDIITVVITDYCYPPDIYCLAPLTPGDHAVTEELHNMGDINWDGVIDIEDNETCQAAMDSSMGSSNWNSVCDLNNDGTVGLADIGILNGNFGKENPAYIIVGGEKITYDHVRLIFKFKKEQTEFTPLSPGTLEVYAWVGVVEVNAIVAIGLGDVDWSGVVDDADLWFYDAANPNSCMNTIPGDVNWDIDCDMNLDNVIDGDDLNIVNLQKGKAIQIYTTDFTETLDVGAYTLRAKYLEMIQQKTAFIFPGLVTRVDFYFSECTPAGDIICHSLYPSGGYDITCTGLERHWAGNNVNGVCDAEKVCYDDYTCKLVNATLTYYDLPTGTFALSDTITIDYTIENTGEITWSFLTLYDIVLIPDGSSSSMIKWNTIDSGFPISDFLTYDIGCDINHVGSWTGASQPHVWTDEMVNGGWEVYPGVGIPISWDVVECLNDEDCETCFPGLGSICNTTSNTCIFPECTPAGDIICHSLYPSGGYDITCTGLERHWAGNNVNGVCDAEKVCYSDYTCKLVNATLTDYDLPTGTFALSDTITTPYTINNTGEIKWTFLTEYTIRRADGSYILPKSWDELEKLEEMDNSFTHDIGCDIDHVGTWTTYLYVWTDEMVNGGWDVEPPTPSVDFTVVECLNDEDCETCFPGLGSTCDTTSNTCVLPECTPGEDIICHSLYPSGGFDITCTGLERHWSGNNVNGVCDDSEVCYDDYTCKFVNATLTDYDLPTGTFALSDTISIPYTTKNTGEITWSFLTESRIVDPGKDGIPGTGDENWLYTLPQFDTLVNGDLASGSLTYPIGCDNITGSWEASIYVYTDFVILGIGGWNVHPFEPYESFTVVECLNDDDCETCFPGLGYTCDTDSNKCSSPGSDEELVGTCMDVHDVTTFFVYCCGICGSLDFDWGDASCTGTGCVCSSGTQNTLFESYVYRVGGDGYGYLKGCISDSGSSRPIGGCVEVFDGGSTTRYYCHDAWGDGFCSGDTCACSTGTREHGYYSDVWNSVLLDRGMGYHKICMNTTPTATKIVGGCTEFRDIGTGIWDWCGRSWGSGSCSGTSCTCSRGIPTTWFGEAYAWDHIDSEETYSYSVVCVD